MNITDKRFLALLSIILITWAVVYQQAILGMEAIWSRSDTFAHGYFILPISIWLLWRDKEHLLASKVSATWLPLPILAGSLFVWLFSYAADINVLGQLSAVISLICLLWLMVGNKIAWRYKFPLAYLVFAVPMGENLIPQLQDITAWFTVFFLKLNGIPVFVDGLYIQIPTGMFEVAVACSGIRYLIASIAVGTLFAYLTYNKTYKQIIFILFAMLLPILANGIRAYGIVAIAYYSDMKYATGVDHLIYGWLFFGVVIMLMFYIGGLFADKDVEEVNDVKQMKPNINSETAIHNRLINGKHVTVFMLLMATWAVFHTIPVIDQPTTPRAALTGEAVKHSLWGITFNDGVQRSHIIDNKGIETFRAVYANKQSQGELINHNNVLHNPDAWTVVESKQVNVDNELALIVHLRNIQGVPASYIYQYKLHDYQGISSSNVKFRQAIQSLFRQSDYSEINAAFMPGKVNIGEAEPLLLNALEQLLAEGN
ncbi:exosortase A [Colwellia sp. 39_35_sub15_T18]|nr:exosortase A [Colwellia sp. 39_35_sub15_T18]